MLQNLKNLYNLDTVYRDFFIHLVDFPSFIPKEKTLVASCLVSCKLGPSEKRSTLKGKNLLPLGANSFLLE